MCQGGTGVESSGQCGKIAQRLKGMKSRYDHIHIGTQVTT